MSTSSTAPGTLLGQPQRSESAVGAGGIPRYVAYTSPVSTTPTADRTGSRATTLPLNLVLLIVAQLDDIADVARVTRTCRLLYYMTLPQLYTRVALHSYPEIRYVNGRPEGFGSGSPFLMALNGFVSGPHANLVQDFRVWGQWNEFGVDDFAKGRVPDNNVMLNILLRAATDKMTKLQSFSWELDCKPLKTLYQGIAAHNTLTSLTIKFPSSRLPRPSVMVPPMANLRAFKAMDIDPLCYPDDISMLLLHSKRLEDLRLHFSPRMRREAESSLSLDTYFGRCLSAHYKLRVKHFAIQNFFGRNMQGLDDLLDQDVCKSIAFIDMFGGAQQNARNVFLDDTWRFTPVEQLKTKFEVMRTNEPAPQHVRLLSQSSGLRRLYIISARPSKTGYTPESADSAPVTPAGETPPDQANEAMVLGKEYLHVLTRHHGPTLTHLLLSDQWPLSKEDVGELVRFCPNLEQLGLALSNQGQVDEGEAPAMSTLRLLLPFLLKLTAIRILSNDWTEKFFSKHTEEVRVRDIGYLMEKSGSRQIRWLGLAERTYWTGSSITDESGERIRDIKEATLDDVKHVPIWGLDCLDLWVDPVARFNR